MSDIEDLIRALASSNGGKEDKALKNQKEAVKQLTEAHKRINVLKEGDYVVINEKEGHNFKYPMKSKNQLGLVLKVGDWLADNDSTCDNVLVLVAIDKNHTRVFRMAEHLLEKVNVLKAV